MGRVSHPDFLNGETPVAPSAIAVADTTYTPSGKKPYVTPRELTSSEIAATVRDYAQATVRAREAGFTGVDIHAATAISSTSSFATRRIVAPIPTAAA